MGKNKDKDIFYSLPQVWDFCLDKIYNKDEYVEGLIELLQQQGITDKSLILDAGCGSGFPAIDLVDRGYRVVGVDKSSEMARQIKLNAQARGVSIEAYNAKWSDLKKRFEPIFDFVYCRGNSLVYAASWEQNWFVPDRSCEEILEAIKNFYAVLKPGGKLYVDVTNKDEVQHEDSIGQIETEFGPVEISWGIKRDQVNQVRAWTIVLKFLDYGMEREFPSYSYLLNHDELIGFFQQAGFTKIECEVPVRGENNYNVFIVHK